MSLWTTLGNFLGHDDDPVSRGVAPEAVEPGSREAVVVDALRTVLDPEIGINIVDLGLIYGVDVSEEGVHVSMTMTTPACPLGAMIRSESRRAVEDAMPGVQVRVVLVWDPAWTSSRVTEQGRRDLGLIDE